MTQRYQLDFSTCMPRAVLVGNPAVATEIAYASVELAWDEIIAINLTLTCDANVASRRCSLVFGDGTNIMARAVCQTLMVAGTVNNICFTPLVAAVAFANSPLMIVSGMPRGILLPFGGTIDTVSQLLQVGDQYSAITIYTHRRFQAF